MSNSYFSFKQFTIQQDRCAMKVTTDSCLFGAWVAEQIKGRCLEGHRVLDIGTGTGLLSLMLAQKNPGLLIDAVEIETAAAKQAAENVQNSAWKTNIRIIQNDVNKLSINHSYNLIISNPPFYEMDLKSPDVLKTMAHHEAALALTTLLQIVKTNLADDGMFALLVPFKRYQETVQKLTGAGFKIRQAMYVRQSNNHQIFRVMLLATLESKGLQLVDREIAIKETKAHDAPYTSEFKSLLKDYYLHL